MSGQTVLVVAAHPDDEVLGFGGSAARHSALGDSVNVLILAEGETSRDKDGNPQERQEKLESLRMAAGRAAEILGTKPPEFAGFPDNRMDSVTMLEVVKRVENTVEMVAPQIVYTHHGDDLNVDHQIAHKAVLTACRPLPGSAVRQIYAFETLTSTEWSSPFSAAPFIPVRYHDISSYMDQKLAAIECYGMEMRPFPHPRSIEAIVAQARLRGSHAGLEAAEAFEVIREIC